MASREPHLLHSKMQELVRSWLVRVPFDVLIYCTAREAHEQAVLYSHGRTEAQIASGVLRLDALKLAGPSGLLARQNPTPGPRVTNALPGLSFHQSHWLESEYAALALDFVPLSYGKPLWSDMALYEEAGAKAEEVGLTWSGRWKTFRETAHLQYDRQGEIKIIALAQGAYR